MRTALFTVDKVNICIRTSFSVLLIPTLFNGFHTFPVYLTVKVTFRSFCNIFIFEYRLYIEWIYLWLYLFDIKLRRVIESGIIYLLRNLNIQYSSLWKCMKFFIYEKMNANRFTLLSSKKFYLIYYKLSLLSMFALCFLRFFNFNSRS